MRESKMLESLTIIDFQAHQRIDIDLDPLVTFLVGPNDAGKTAIIRALYWLTFNRPDGDDFIRHGTDRAVIRIKIDGHRISRRRGKGENTYKLDDQEFAALGRANVPDPVRQVLNLDTVNFQRQHDPLYLFSDTPGQVAQALNQIFSLEVIDSTLAEIASQHRQIKAEVRVCQDRLTAARKRRDELEWVPPLIERLDALEGLRDALEGQRQYHTSLQSLVEEAEDCQKVLNQDARALATLKKSHLSAACALAELQEVQTRRQNLEALLDEIDAVGKELWRAQRDFSTAEKEFKRQTRGQSCPVCQKPLT